MYKVLNLVRIDSSGGPGNWFGRAGVNHSSPSPDLVGICAIELEYQQLLYHVYNIVAYIPK